MKYCTLCNLEFRDAFERCTECGAGLAAEDPSGHPGAAAADQDQLQLIWRGGDPEAVGRVIGALRAAGIRHHVLANHDNLVFELAMRRPKYDVRVFAGDAPAARELVGGIYDAPPFGTGLSIAEEPAALPERAVRDDRAPDSRGEASVEVWSGEDSRLLKMLEACLSENRIAFRRTGDATDLIRLRVAPADEQASREIIREVVEAAPTGSAPLL